MKKLFTIILTFVIVVTLAACTKNDASDLKIYVIKRDTVEGLSDNIEILSALKTDGRLVFDGSDIQGYNWQTHTITFKETSVPSHGSVTEEDGGSAIFKTNDTYAFVIALKNSIIYTGGFKQGLKNPRAPLQPSISDDGRYSCCITYDSKYASGSDVRSNKKLYDFLSVCGLLSAKTE